MRDVSMAERVATVVPTFSATTANFNPSDVRNDFNLGPSPVFLVSGSLLYSTVSAGPVFNC